MTAALAGRSTRRLSEVARHVVIPDGIVDSLWFDVAERCAEFGDSFDKWQDGLGQVALGLRKDGMFAATVGGITLSIPRQVAKTFIVMRIVVALCTLFPNVTVLWTAHRLRTTTNTFQKAKAYAMRPAVRQHLKAGTNRGTAIRDANGEQEIPFKNGSRILFGAREQGFGRGFDEVDVEVFDEAQILTERALDDMVAATNQSRFPHGALLFYMGTPPRPIDPGEAFAARRKDALTIKGDSDDFSEPTVGGDAVYIECSADGNVGTKGGPDLDDMNQVAIANPSYPDRTPEVSVRRLRKNLPSDDGWRREGLGVWDDDAGITPAVINISDWDAHKIDTPPDDGLPCYGVRFSADGSAFAVAVALKRHDAPVFVEVIDRESTSVGIDGVATWLADRWSTAGNIVIDGLANAGALTDELRRRGVPPKWIVRPTMGQLVTGNSTFVEWIREGRIQHAGQPGLTDSIAQAARRKIGTQGGWGFEPNTPDGDVLPTEASALAVLGTTLTKRKPAADKPTSNRRAAGQSTGRSGGVM